MVTLVANGVSEVPRESLSPRELARRFERASGKLPSFHGGE
jgi:hypothetical protein